MSGMIAAGHIPTALVLGAHTAAGAGVVGALIEAGSPVLAIGERGEYLDALAECYRDESQLTLLPREDRIDETSARLLADEIRARGLTLHAVFAHLFAPSFSGRLLEKSSEQLGQRFGSDVLSHLAAARHLLPLLQQEHVTTHYVMIGGPATECGWAGHGHASIGSAALHMLAKVLHEEAAPLGVRAQLLAVEHPLSTPKNRLHACAGWPDAMSVGRKAVELLRPTKPGPVRAIVRFDAAWTPPPLRTLFDPLPQASVNSALDLNRG
jgi:NAD(P)-dependent dehydrogenase (short-subunit alcohol dehydrogenase family)